MSTDDTTKELERILRERPARIAARLALQRAAERSARRLLQRDALPDVQSEGGAR